MDQETKEMVLTNLKDIYNSLLDGDNHEATVMVEGLILEIKDINEVY
jgi:hypothetical protein